LNRPAERLPDSVIQVMERGDNEERTNLVAKVKEHDPTSYKGGRGSPEIKLPSAKDESHAQRVNGDTLTEEA
jgi:hypothetical protein